RHITLRVELRNAADQDCFGQCAEAACDLRAGQAELVGDQVEVVDAVLGFGSVRGALSARLGLVRQPVLELPSAGARRLSRSRLLAGGHGSGREQALDSAAAPERSKQGEANEVRRQEA